MTAPNLGAAGTLLGVTTPVALTTSPQNVAAAAASHTVKVVSLYVGNNTTATADVTVDVYRSSTAYAFAYTVTVPPKTTVVVVGKDAPIYLQENDALRAAASVNSALVAVCSAEDAS